MLKMLIQIYPVIPAKDEAERAALRPIGRNRERYHEAVHEWTDIIKAADDLGVWGAATIEHHFWSEGYEVGPSPGVLNAYWAAVTKRIKVGAMGYVMSTQHPIRVAEETAIVDHLSKGRCFVGFARGYQSRWTNVVGQHLGARATKSPSGATYNPSGAEAGFSTATSADRDLSDDAINRAVFEENVDIVMKSWTETSFRHKGPNWQIPFPYDTGVDDWPLANAGVTQKFGAADEIDERGHTHTVSVAPAPYTRPHPKVFVTGSGSPETIDFCANRGFTPCYFTEVNTAEKLGQRYRDVARQAGYDWATGQNQCVARWVQFGETEEQALDNIRRYDMDIWKNFYTSMGRRKVDPNDLLGSLIRSGLYYHGTVEKVRDKMIEAWKIMPAEFLMLGYHFAQMPKDAVIDNMDIFVHKIKPYLDEIVHEQQVTQAQKTRA